MTTNRRSWREGGRDRAATVAALASRRPVCPPAEQTSCCEPAAKTACCGDPHAKAADASSGLTASGRSRRPLGAETPWLEFRERLRAFVARRVSNPADVEDIVQWVFLQMQRRLGAIRNGERDPRLALQHRSPGDHRLLPFRAPPARGARPAMPWTSMPCSTLRRRRARMAATSAAEMAACLAPVVERLAPTDREAIVLTEIPGTSLCRGRRPGRTFALGDEVESPTRAPQAPPGDARPAATSRSTGAGRPSAARSAAAPRYPAARAPALRSRSCPIRAERQQGRDPPAAGGGRSRQGSTSWTTYYAPGYVDHTPSPIRGLASGRDGVRQAFALFRQAFPDTRHTIEDLVAEGDRVVARISARGTHTGELFGHAPTGRVVTLSSITIYRLVDGQIVERWAEQGLGVLEQLGIPAPRPTDPSAHAPTGNSNDL